MKKAITFLIVTAVFVLALSGVALAATAQDIYEDYSADLKLDGTYTDAELEGYLSDATVRQYGSSALVTSLDTVVSSMLTDERSTFPFTGAQLALMGIVVAGLIGGGIALRRAARSRT